jgi:uncharacterized protein (DUF983 family)
VLKSALLGRCPQCGRGPAMSGLFMGGVVLLLSLPLMRFAKAMLIGLQWRYRGTN